MYSKSFQQLLKDMLSKVIDSKDLKSSLEIIAKSISAYYPNSKIWFTESFGKRRSYIIGAGKETYKPVETLEFANRYVAFLQNLSDLTLKEKSNLTDLLNMVTIIQEG